MRTSNPDLEESLCMERERNAKILGILAFFV